MTTLGGGKTQDYNFLRSKRAADKEPVKPKALTEADMVFLNRQDADIEERRRTAFICELRKDPRFRPEMLEPPKSKFQTVSVEGGPVIKTHRSNRTGYEAGPLGAKYKWGPLGGW